jgi:hypothetical protein
LEQIDRDNTLSARFKTQLDEYQNELRRSVAGTSGQGAQHP